jgi:AbrB family looped-hinge helix DNA binding protein
MESITISPKYQVVIPQSVRERLGLKVGEKVHVMSYRNRIEMIPVQEMRRMRGFLKGMSTDFRREEGDRV